MDLYLVVISEISPDADGVDQIHVRRMFPVPVPSNVAQPRAAIRKYLKKNVWPEVIEEKPSADKTKFRVDYRQLAQLGTPWD